MACGPGTAQLTEQRKTAPPPHLEIQHIFRRNRLDLTQRPSNLTQTASALLHTFNCQRGTFSSQLDACARLREHLPFSSVHGQTVDAQNATRQIWGKMALFLHRTCPTGGPALGSGISIFGVGLLDYRKDGVINS